MCNREAPSVEEASKRWAGKAHFVGVAWSGDDDAFQGFVDKHGLTFPTISDPDGDVYARFGIPAQPAMVVVNLAGDVMSRLGPVEAADLDAALEDAGG
ncbi:MAG: redoxin domain-containing protein [Ilumatobacteraceae bacterium]